MDTTQNEQWERNHVLISLYISTCLEKAGRIPSKAEIAKATGLSRLTVHKHIKDSKQNPLFEEQEEEFKMVKDRLMGMLYQMAMKHGNVNAVRLFFEASGIVGNAKTVNKNIIENQHNYIQINETRLSQDEIKKLSPERLKQLEELLKLPEKAEG
ncbi:MAG TPA: hypothetical protein VN922_23625 [Bacteroidia bacterium]|nr:hypothetical protein [Bacteroidia bacterium]